MGDGSADCRCRSGEEAECDVDAWIEKLLR